MLATLHEVLPDAKKQHYAVGLFNTVNLEMAKGVLSAAEEAKAPVIIGTAEVFCPMPNWMSSRISCFPWLKRPLCRWCSTTTTV